MKAEYNLTKEEMDSVSNGMQAKTLLKFGKGNLMPVFSISKNKQGKSGVVIGKIEHGYEVGEMVSAVEAGKWLETYEPLVYLEFDHSEKGIQSIQSLKEWLNILQDKIKEEAE